MEEEDGLTKSYQIGGRFKNKNSKFVALTKAERNKL